MTRMRITQKDCAAIPLQNVPAEEKEAVLAFIEEYGTKPGPPNDPPGVRRIWLRDYRKWWEQQPGCRQKYFQEDFEGYWTPRRDEIQKGLFRHFASAELPMRPKWEDGKSYLDGDMTYLIYPQPARPLVIDANDQR